MSGGLLDETKIIQVQHVQQQFVVAGELIPVLRSADFSIQANTFTIIFGPSGSGKSTLLNVLAGLQAPSTGKLIIEGHDVYAMSPNELAHFRANRVGFVHQTNHWIKSLNVIENLSVPLYFLGYSKAKAAKLAMVALERVNMAAYAKKNPTMLSGGEQQRLGTARALANDPLFIIADEPTGNLDTVNGDMIMDLLLNAQTEFRRTVILVTHNMEYVSLADHLLKIQDGIVEDIQSSDVHRVTDVLVDDIKKRIDHLSEVKRSVAKVA